MAISLPAILNPCLLAEYEQIPAKIWELLRRNEAFRAQVERLRNLDEAERKHRAKGAKHDGRAWQIAWKLVAEENERNAFAGIALQWLVPEPVFHVSRIAKPLGKSWEKKVAFVPKVLLIGEGTTPNYLRKIGWRWWKNSSQANHSGRLMRRGPKLHLTISQFKSGRDKVNSFKEWKKYKWPFTLGHGWQKAPPAFCREFEHLWRSKFDSRPVNPISNNRVDAPFARETDFFRGWSLSDFSTHSGLATPDLVKIIKFESLAHDYHVFAIPKTVLTKQAASAMGEWVATQLKKGLRNDGELLGTCPEWEDWLAQGTSRGCSAGRDSHYYRRMKYMHSLSKSVYPVFDLTALLVPPKHRARYKDYVPKGRQK